MNKMITILGPTACGKTSVATQLAALLDGEIISADSRQVYSRMDIGTGKDLDDYTVEGKRIPYHLIDIVEPGTKYSVYRYQHDFLEAYEDITARGVTPILCGGSGLYVESVLRGYRLMPVPQNPELRESLKDRTLAELTAILEELKRKNGGVMHNSTDVDTTKRAIRAIEIEECYSHTPMDANDFPKIESTIVGITVDRDIRRQRITERLKQRLDGGMVDEVKGLIAEGIHPEDLIYYGLEYKFITLYVIGQLTYDEMFSQLNIAIHQFAKRQMTWFRGMERRGVKINWIDGARPMEEKIKIIMDLTDE
jgi:tRNA dimethylallyltransferase